MRLLFALGVHDALEKVSSELKDGKHRFAYLDDVYAECSPERVRGVYDSLAHHLHVHAGVRLHQGKTRV